MSRCCSHCGAELREEARFCPKCGTAVSEEPAAAGQPGEPTTPKEPEKAEAPHAPKEPEKAPAAKPREKFDPSRIQPRKLTQEEKRRCGLAVLVVTLLSVLMILVLSVLITRWMAGKDPRLGRYENVGSHVGELTLDPEGEWLELQKNGKMVISIDGKELEGKWTLEEEAFRMKQGGEHFDGTLAEGLLTLTINDREFFFHQKQSAPETAAPEETEAAPEAEASQEAEAPQEAEARETAEVWEVSEYGWWDGDFYGWWISKDSMENWHSGQEFTFWDLCATIDVDGDEGTLKLWDTDCAALELLGEVRVSFGPGATEQGAMTAQGGSFDFGEIREGDWTVEPGWMGFSQMVCMEGSYELYGVTRDYMIFLRPWGMSWEDVRTAPPQQLFFRDMMPAHYDDWYWPLAREEMPEYFVGLVFPRLREQ